ncbi:MAG: diguanylate cyclase (GGDEF)-like protein [Acidimicrobiales bacterium]
MTSAARGLAATNKIGLADLTDLADSVQRSKAYLRIFGSLAAAAVTPLLPRVENRWQIFLVLSLFALHSLLDARYMPAKGASQREAYLDILLVTVIGLLEPAAWLPGVVALQGALSYHAVRLPWRALLPIASLTILSATFLSYVLEGPWFYTLLAMPLATATAARFGDEFRVALLQVQFELEAALSAASAIAHLTPVSGSGRPEIVGDVKAVTGWSMKEWSETDHRTLMHEDDLDQYWIDSDKIVAGRQYERLGRVRRPNGEYAWLRDISRGELSSTGEMLLRGLTYDVSGIEAANQRIRHQARHDQLTGLPNRVVLNETLETHLGNETPFALLALDLNRFKEINDTLGHHFGDDVLCAQAGRLKRVIRPGDVVVRLGGDEFAVIARGLNSDEAATELAERISRKLAEPITLRDLTVVASASIGISMSDESTKTAETLLRHADIAMYEAKKHRSEVRVFTPELEIAKVGDVTLGAELVNALDAGEILLHFQPQVNLDTREIVGAEGLARWEHPTRGLLVPGDFLHLLDISEAHRRFTDQMIRQAIECARRCNDAGHPLSVAVNVSVRSLQDPDFARRVGSLLAAEGLPPHLLMIEITEQDLQDNGELVLEVLGQLASTGVEFSIDDFGTGFSSLERLRDLPVHELKVDRTFVQRAPSNRKDRVIAGTIIDLAARLGHKLVAEGVETEEQASILRELGCQTMQGYLFGRAEPVDEFVERLAQAEMGYSGHLR